MTERPYTDLKPLYRQHSQWLCTYLQHKVQNPADAEDLCQQIFLRLCEHPEQLGHIRNPRAWLATVASRMCVDHWRKGEGIRKAVDTLAHQPEPEVPSPEQQVSNRQMLEMVVDQLATLPDNITSIFIDTRVHALTGKQVARHHNVSLRTVRNHLNLTTQFLVATCRREGVVAAAGF